MEYINIKYALIESFLIKAKKEILDISYNINEREITIQTVLLEGFNFPDRMIKDAKGKLSDFDIIVNELHLTKKQFNESRGEWRPKHYKWLDYLLFSKAEML